MIKYFHSAMAGAPTLSGTAGAMISVLDACLVTGFGVKAVTSLVVAGGIATMTMSAGHSFEVDTVALIEGATPGGLNGEKKILAITSTTATFDATGISDQTATGTISTKLAPLGFAKSFTGTNLAVYRSANPASTRMSLRVNDTGTTNARVLGYESMTDVNTGLGPFPTEAQVAGGRWWPKSNTANTTSRLWAIVGDDKTFYVYVYTSTAPLNAAGCIFTFGDFVSERSGDPYACMLTGPSSDVSASAGAVADAIQSSTTGQVGIGSIPRPYTFFSGATIAAFQAESFFVNGVSGNVSPFGVFPSLVNNGLYVSPTLVLESPSLLRGRGRGILLVPQVINTAFATLAKVDGRGSLLGRKLLALRGGSPAGSQTNGGMAFFDITGPWI